MLKDIRYEKPPCKRIADTDRDCFFESGLEYNTPARGMWNIVHSGMLLPEAHEIFCCAQGCLRGVILTAAEMLTLDRMSWISVSEEDMFDGTIETDVIDGVTEIIEKLGKRPPVVLLYLSCIHLFAGVDFEAIINELHERFPDIWFSDCYMTPTMRTTVSPVAKMAAQLYDALKPMPLDPKSVNIIGNDRATDEGSELVKTIRGAGFTLCDITLCKTFDEYLEMAKGSLNITYIPTAVLAGGTLEERFGARHLYLPNSFVYDTIEENHRTLCEALGIGQTDLSAERAAADSALEAAHEVIGDTAVAIDFTAVTRPFELAELLIAHGFNVRYVIADGAGEEGDAFDRLKAARPDLEIYAAANVNMLNMRYEPHEKVLAVGQKAAYYFATDNFVNIILNGGYYGYSGIVKLAELMTDAYRNEKDRKRVISLKGYGCASCLA